MVGLIGVFVATGMACIFTFPMFQIGGIAVVMSVISLLVVGFALISSLFTYFCFQIKIEEGFYYQTRE